MARKVTTALSFHEGRLVPAGTVIDIADELAHGDNLADVGDASVNRPVAIAPIAPTGPLNFRTVMRK